MSLANCSGVILSTTSASLPEDNHAAKPPFKCPNKLSNPTRLKRVTASSSLPSSVTNNKGCFTSTTKAPTHSASWRIGATQAQAFLGEVGGQNVAIMIAKEGPQAGKVISAFVPDANQLSLMLSR